ncbi:MAG: TOBE domain-containing protein [Firmicutes bacterium]|nr:TOBE domain-containing protein [Bacillota bacterium]
MADRIAAINLGGLQQVGTPYKWFNRPRNLFFADLVGEPPMNLLDIKVAKADGGIVLGGSGLSLKVTDPRICEVAASVMGKPVVLGIRPIHLQLHTSSPSANAVPGTVSLFEDLGDSAIVGVQVNGLLIRAETSSERRAHIGDKVFLDFPAD